MVPAAVVDSTLEQLLPKLAKDDIVIDGGNSYYIDDIRRAGKLKATEMQGGSFTISSLGGIGGTAFTPIINAPEVAILGVSRASQKPVYERGAFIPRLMLPLSLSYDHRVIDGALGAQLLQAFKALLEQPLRLLA